MEAPNAHSARARTQIPTVSYHSPMLASLLPGLRDLRTPLAVGYLWLVGLWLIFHDSVPINEASATGPLRSAYQLGGALGASAVLAAVSFVAYLLGVMILLRLEWNVFAIMYPGIGRNPLRGRNFWIAGLTGFLTKPLLIPYGPACAALEDQLTLVLEGEFVRLPRDIPDGTLVPIFQKRSLSVEDSNAIEAGLRSTERGEAAVLHAGRLIGMELPAVAIQLQAENRDLWDTFDRAKAESEFRSAIAWPLAFIILIISFQVSWWWAFLLLVPIFLMFLAMGESVQATSTLVQAIVLGIVKPPIFAELNAVIPRSPKVEDENKTLDAPLPEPGRHQASG